MAINKAVSRLIRKSSADEMTYPFTQGEIGLSSTSPKSTFGIWVVSALGSTPMMVIGSVMTASSVTEWGVPLLAASVAGFATPIGIGRSRHKKFSAKVQKGLNELLPRIIFGSVPEVSEEQAKALSKGKTVTLPIPGGGDVTIKLGKDLLNTVGDVLTEEWDAAISGYLWGDESKQKEIKKFRGGTIYLNQPQSGAAEFQALLENLKTEQPAVRKAIEAVEARKALESSAQQRFWNVASAAPEAVRSYLRPKAQQDG